MNKYNTKNFKNSLLKSLPTSYGTRKESKKHTAIHKRPRSIKTTSLFSNPKNFAQDTLCKVKRTPHHHYPINCFTVNFLPSRISLLTKSTLPLSSKKRFKASTFLYKPKSPSSTTNVSTKPSKSCLSSPVKP